MNFRKPEESPVVKEQIAKVREKLNTSTPGTESYRTLLGDLAALHDIEKTKPRRSPVSGDMMLMVGGNLLLGGILIFAEHKAILSQTGLRLLISPKSHINT